MFWIIFLCQLIYNISTLSKYEVSIHTARRMNRCRSIRTASKVELGLGLVYRVRVSFR